MLLDLILGLGALYVSRPASLWLLAELLTGT